MYGKVFNKPFWAPDFSAKKPKVHITLPFAPGEDETTDRMLELIADKTVDVTLTYTIGSTEHLAAINFNDMEKFTGTYIQGFCNWTRALTDADEEQINRAMLSFVAHVLAVAQKKPPRQLCPQIDHVSISFTRAVPEGQPQPTDDPDRALWIKYLDQLPSTVNKPSEKQRALWRMMPSFTAADADHCMFSMEERIPLSETVQKSMDVWCDPYQSHLWKMTLNKMGVQCDAARRHAEKNCQNVYRAGHVYQGSDSLWAGR